MLIVPHDHHQAHVGHWDNDTLLHFEHFSRDPVSLLHTSFERAGSAALDIRYMDPSPKYWRQDSSDIAMIAEALFSLILLHSHHWLCVDFLVMPRHLSALRSVRGRLPMLQYVDLSVHDSAKSNALIQMDAFEGASSLEKMSVADLGAHTHLSLAPMGSLRMFFDTRDTAHNMLISYLSLMSAPNMHTFEIRLCRVSSEETRALEALPQDQHWISPLEVLTICCSALLDRITLPNLITLTIGFWDTGRCVVKAAEILPRLLTLIARSKCNLTSLSLFDVVHDSSILDVIPVIDTLEELCFVANDGIWTLNYDVTIHLLVLRLLQTTPSTTQVQFAVLPRLRSLGLFAGDSKVEENPFGFLDDSFTQMVEERVHHGFLRSVEVSLESGTSHRFRGLLKHDVKRLKRVNNLPDVNIRISCDNTTYLP